LKSGFWQGEGKKCFSSSLWNAAAMLTWRFLRLMQKVGLAVMRSEIQDIEN
jgi:hypothetical protein